jgi:hypothetical protein
MHEMSFDLSGVTEDGQYGLTKEDYDACAEKAKLTNDYTIDISKFKLDGTKPGEIWLLVAVNKGRQQLTLTTPGVYSMSSIGKQKDKRLTKTPSQAYLNLKSSKHYGR